MSRKISNHFGALSEHFAGNSLHIQNDSARFQLAFSLDLPVPFQTIPNIINSETKADSLRPLSRNAGVPPPQNQAQFCLMTQTRNHTRRHSPGELNIRQQ
ncbi:MAG: hypothetical protein CME32_20260 [Gimesia sp.]|nr:hypothetical protein [Gimesia sp.]